MTSAGSYPEETEPAETSPFEGAMLTALIRHEEKLRGLVKPDLRREGPGGGGGAEAALRHPAGY